MSSLCGQYPLATAEATTCYLTATHSTPTGRDKPGAEDKRQKALKGTPKPDSKVSSTSTVTVGADGDVESLVGRMADILRVTETPEVLSIASSEWSTPKLRDFFGQDAGLMWQPPSMGRRPSTPATALGSQGMKLEERYTHARTSRGTTSTCMPTTSVLMDIAPRRSATLSRETGSHD